MDGGVQERQLRGRGQAERERSVTLPPRSIRPHFFRGDRRGALPIRRTLKHHQRRRRLRDLSNFRRRPPKTRV